MRQLLGISSLAVAILLTTGCAASYKGAKSPILSATKAAPPIKSAETMLYAPATVPNVLPQQLVTPPMNTESYDRIEDNPFLEAKVNPLSTFSVDVDTASYSNMRRFLNNGAKPPKDAVRIEELINYFSYSYAPPQGAEPFAFHVAVASCPWTPAHRLVRIAIKGKEIDKKERPASNLVFLLDVSGSMDQENKLPLVKRSMALLVDQLQATDKVAIVVYAGASGLVLEPTVCDDGGRKAIHNAIGNLEPFGSTNGSGGIVLAYETATKGFIPHGTNRVILCTDGDFNVGVTNQGDLTRLIEEKAKNGVFLTVMGFGMGDYKDSTLEKLADKGNGAYAYIDTFNEARKAFVEQMTGTLITIAKDVKIQVEFNPAKVASYRLIGYENRLLRNEDFNDDKKDAGDIGAGHTVTALYEITPVGAASDTGSVDPLIYQKPGELTSEAQSKDLLAVKLRYKEPEGDTSKLLTQRLVDEGASIDQADKDFQFAAAVAEFGMVLRESPHKGQAKLEGVLARAESSRGEDKFGYRTEFLSLVHKAKNHS